ncbi:methyltransferase domain-containing protein [Kineococcus sp. SYSU DK005]|uniref:methyltransferase domain-containing protein n=1 Tax=Kineococcus sp. SYSU DK005 TaxID=3383126 RepID=UPI003D7C5AFD
MCRQRLDADGRRLVCPAGHSADAARQGYVTLTAGARPHPGDTAAMVAARERFLAAGHYEPVARALALLAAELVPAAAFAVDVGGGTGYHLAHVLDALPGATGVCVDTSAPALRRAARAHPRAAALGADAWRALPVADGCADLVTTVFAPRGEAEVARVLRPGGAWVVLTPLPAHLEQVRAALGMVAVEERKRERLAADLAGFDPAAERELSLVRPLDRAALRDLVLMGPSAHHIDAAGLEQRLADLPEVVDVTVAVRLTAVTRPG